MPRSVAAALIFPDGSKVSADIPYSAAASAAERDGEAVLRNFQSRQFLASDRILPGRKAVRDIDHVSGDPARRSCRNLPGVENDDPLTGSKLGKPACGRKPGKSRTDDQPVGIHISIKSPDGSPAGADRLPTGDSGIDRKALDDVPGHRTVSSTERSETSIQIVLSSVYWSCAKIDLSRPPNPDSL